MCLLCVCPGVSCSAFITLLARGLCDFCVSLSSVTNCLSLLFGPQEAPQAGTGAPARIHHPPIALMLRSAEGNRVGRGGKKAGVAPAGGPGVMVGSRSEVADSPASAHRFLCRRPTSRPVWLLGVGGGLGTRPGLLGHSDTRSSSVC